MRDEQHVTDGPGEIAVEIHGLIAERDVGVQSLALPARERVIILGQELHVEHRPAARLHEPLAQPVEDGVVVALGVRLDDVHVLDPSLEEPARPMYQLDLLLLDHRVGPHGRVRAPVKHDLRHQRVGAVVVRRLVDGPHRVLISHRSVDDLDPLVPGEPLATHVRVAGHRLEEDACRRGTRLPQEAREDPNVRPDVEEDPALGEVREDRLHGLADGLLVARLPLAERPRRHLRREAPPHLPGQPLQLLVHGSAPLRAQAAPSPRHRRPPAPLGQADGLPAGARGQDDRAPGPVRGGLDGTSLSVGTHHP